MNYYAVTVKYVKGKAEDVDRSDYGHWLCHSEEVHKGLHYVETHFEQDKGGRLHMHCLLETSLKRLYIKKLQRSGFNIDIQKLEGDEVPKWKNYIKKDMFKLHMM